MKCGWARSQREAIQPRQGGKNRVTQSEKREEARETGNLTPRRLAGVPDLRGTPKTATLVSPYHRKTKTDT